MDWNKEAEKSAGTADGACVESCTNPLREHCPFAVEITQVQRLQSLGLLVGEVVHDLSNLLSLALGHTEMGIENLARGDAADAAVREHLLHSRQALQNCGGLCRDLLVYAGKSSAISTVYDPCPHIEELASLLHVSISRQADFQIEIATDLPALEGDPNHLRQIIMNLVLNASESLQGKDGGRVSLSVSVDRLSFDSADVVAQDANWLKVRVSDNGCGMDAETLQKIGTPFFTTKLTGRGLGLTAVHQLLDAMSGRLSVESKPGEGSCFTVHLPCVHAASCRSFGKDESIDAGAVAHMDGTILLVEDEPELLLVEAAMLERIGLRVLRAGNGEEAVQFFEQEQTSVGLIFLDMMMTEMGGAETLARLRSIRGDVPVVLLSGCSDAWIREHLGSDMPEAVLTKPVSASCLRKTARQWYRDPLKEGS